MGAAEDEEEEEEEEEALASQMEIAWLPAIKASSGGKEGMKAIVCRQKWRQSRELQQHANISHAKKPKRLG